MNAAAQAPQETDPAIRELLARTNERWKDSEKSAERMLIRIAVLRELSHSLHSEKSRCLSTGHKQQAQFIRDLEGRIQKLRDLSSLDGDFQSLLDQSTQGSGKRTRLLPEALFRHIQREKLERYDRHWEAALSAEACKVGWNFWCLTAWTEISRIEEWEQLLRERMWPHGFILFAESAPAEPGKPNTPSGSDTLWHGRWTLILQPHFQTPNDLNLDLSRFPGAPDSPVSPPAWKLLFSPRKR